MSVDSITCLCYGQRATGSEDRLASRFGRQKDLWFLAGGMRGLSQWRCEGEYMRTVIASFVFAVLMFVAASVSWGATPDTATWETATWETVAPGTLW
jgi:hypothetical protein